MLDRAQVLSALECVADSLFVDCSEQYEYLRAGLKILTRTSEMPAFIAQAQTPWALCYWNGCFGCTVPVVQLCEAYAVVAADGSQIYPDRHKGTPCFLIQSATVSFSYGMPQVPRVQFDAAPRVFVGHDDQDAYATANDFVDCVREELELMHGASMAHAWVADYKCAGRIVVLFDGALIFWHLQHKEQHMRTRYAKRYVQYLMQLYQERIPAVWYTSMPRSKELIHLVQAALWYENQVTPGNVVLTHVFDVDVAHMMVTEGLRTPIFEPRVTLCALYPEPVRPRMLYMHVGAEIVRLEFPAWVCADEESLSWVCSVVFDQIHKGSGYPVALAEAHARAVIHGQDREFFYQAVHKLSVSRGHSVSGSLKSAHKRVLRV
jgi:hypothetical protein